LLLLLVYIINPRAPLFKIANIIPLGQKQRKIKSSKYKVVLRHTLLQGGGGGGGGEEQHGHRICGWVLPSCL
jgi:hypothetical protein